MQEAKPIFNIKPQHGEGPIWCPRMRLLVIRNADPIERIRGIFGIHVHVAVGAGCCTEWRAIPSELRGWSEQMLRVSVSDAPHTFSSLEHRSPAKYDHPYDPRFPFVQSGSTVPLRFQSG